MDSPPDEYLEFARAAFEHRECRDKAQGYAGEDRDVTTADTSVFVWRCPHGVRYWLVPVEAGE